MFLLIKTSSIAFFTIFSFSRFSRTNSKSFFSILFPFLSRDFFLFKIRSAIILGSTLYFKNSSNNPNSLLFEICSAKSLLKPNFENFDDFSSRVSGSSILSRYLLRSIFGRSVSGYILAAPGNSRAYLVRVSSANLVSSGIPLPRYRILFLIKFIAFSQFFPPINKNKSFSFALISFFNKLISFKSKLYFLRSSSE